VLECLLFKFALWLSESESLKPGRVSVVGVQPASAASDPPGPPASHWPGHGYRGASGPSLTEAATEPGPGAGLGDARDTEPEPVVTIRLPASSSESVTMVTGGLGGSQSLQVLESRWGRA
jgi:hypothetical protein